MLLMEIDPNISVNLMTKLQPLLFNITMVAVIVGIIKTIAKGDYSNLVIQIIASSIVLVLVKDPNSFLTLGNWLVSFGGDLVEK